MNLTEFLLARIAEDEAVAREICDLEHRGDGWTTTYQWTRLTSHADGGCGIRTFDGAPSPARVLAECEAKRRIMRRHSRTLADHWSGAGNCEGCGWQGESDTPVTMDFEECPELVDLASAYADHPDYDEAWRA